MRSRRTAAVLVFLLWLAFLARGWFYSVVFPLWEGFDEWSHYAFVEHVASGRGFLPTRDAPVSRAVAESLRLAPLPRNYRDIGDPIIEHHEYALVPSEERVRREGMMRGMPAALQREPSTGPLIYEALQPPAYYWLMAVPASAAGSWALGDRVMLLRWLSVLMASLAIPLCYRFASNAFEDRRAGVAVTALVCAMPGLQVDIARVGNDSLALPVFSLLTLLCLRIGDDVRVRSAAAIGATLGLGLLTKAYFLTALPAIFLLLACAVWMRKSSLRKALRNAAVTIGTAALISGWWYARNLISTGTVSGLSESVLLKSKGLADYWNAAVSIPWFSAVDSILFSHLWYGGWSGLQARSWMYHVFYLAILVALMGLARGAFKRQWNTALLVAAALYGCFWLGQIYNVLLIFLSKGAATSMGWYLYCAVATQSVLVIAGFRWLGPRSAAGAYAPAAGSVLFALLDFYGMHLLSIPYYSGLLQPQANGRVPTFRPLEAGFDGWMLAMERLETNKPGLDAPAMVLVSWLLYLAATVGTVSIGAWCSRPAAVRSAKRPYAASSAS